MLSIKKNAFNDEEMKSLILAMEADCGPGVSQGATQWISLRKSIRVYYIHYLFAVNKRAVAATTAGQFQAIFFLIPWRTVDPNNFNALGQAFSYPPDDNFKYPASPDITNFAVAPGNPGRYNSLIEGNVKGFATTTSVIPANVSGSMDYKPEGRYLEEGTSLGLHLDVIDNTVGATGNIDTEIWLNIAYKPVPRMNRGGIP